jgi:hypothetical protein
MNFRILHDLTFNTNLLLLLLVSLIFLAYYFLYDFVNVLLGTILNPAPENTRSSNSDAPPPRVDRINPNLVFGLPNSMNPQSNYPPQQIPLDIPRLPDNRQPFPMMGGSGSQYPYIPPYHPDLTPPPNVFGPYRVPTTTSNPNFLDQFFNSKQQRNFSTINNANINLTIFGLLFLLIYRISNNMA